MFRRILMAGMLLALSAGAGGAAPLLISVDFGRSGDGSAHAGVEPVAAAADTLFGAAGTWNFVTRPFSGDNSLPASYDLVDASGAATGVTLHLGPAFGFGNGNAVRETYLFWFAGEVAWSITGLAAGAAYAFYAYSSDFPTGVQDRSFDMTIGSDTRAVTAGHLNGTHFAHLVADAQGRISGVAGVPRPGPLASEANWAGFQLAAIPAIPLPAPALLLLSGLAALGGMGMARSTRRIDRNAGVRPA